MAPGDESTGARIGQARKVRGLTQRALAMRAHVSYSLLTKIESGHAMASPAVLAALARALQVDVTQLTGQPYVSELREAGLEELVEPLRLAFDAYDLPAVGVKPRPLEAIEADVRARCQDVMVDGLVGKAAAELPGLLDELRALAGTTEDARAWRVLAHAYRAGQHVASKWGYRDLAVVALDRMAWAAERGDDPLLAALRYHERAHEHLRAGQYHHGRILLARARATAEAAPEGIERRALIGQAHLAASVHAARSGDAAGADDHLGVAGEIAQRLGEVPHLYAMSFGPTNVALHRVAVLVDRDRHDEALTVAESLPLPAHWHATRLAHLAMDRARAHAVLGQHDRALAALDDARRLAPRSPASTPPPGRPSSTSSPPAAGSRRPWPATPAGWACSPAESGGSRDTDRCVRFSFSLAPCSCDVTGLAGRVLSSPNIRGHGGRTRRMP